MKKSTKIIRLSVALLLLIAMLLTPMSPIFAVVIDGSGDADLTAADIVSEDASKREKFSRHYLTGDGTYFAVSYAEQVNYQDDDGNWIAVDNSLSTNVLTGEKSTKNEKFKVKFANKANKDDLVTIKTSEYDVSFGITVSEDGESYLELNKVKGTESTSNTSAEPKTTQEATSLGKAVSGITYVDAFSDYLDVRYSVAHEKVKEDLILERKSSFNSYKVTYNIKEKDALAILNDDGSITFTSPDGAVLFNVGIPVMYDSDGKSSADIAVSMTQDKKTVEVIYTPSAEWLNDEERVYPVTIDPTVSSPKATSNIVDFSCANGEYDNIDFSNTTLFMGGNYYAYIRFNSVAALPSGASLLNSYLMLHGTNMTDRNVPYVQIGRIYEYWDTDSFSYEDGYYNETNPIGVNPVITVYNISIDNDGMDFIELSLNNFYSSALGCSNFYSPNNYGFLINMAPIHDFRACSSEYSPLYCRPCVVVSYADPLPNGTYCISNASDSITESLITNNGSASFLLDFDESDNQLWEITNLGNGYYKIINSETSAALTSSNLENYSYSYSGSNNQLWIITQTSSGNYTLQSKSQANGQNNYVLGMNSAGNLENSDYTQSSNSANEWKICILKFKYVNYYDSSFANTDLINYIPDAVDFANTVYSNLCGITFEMEGSATQYMNFVADQCQLGSNTPCGEPCGSSCTSHHKNIVNISNQFYNLGIADNERYVIWTNKPLHTYCNETDNGTHSTIDKLAGVYAARPVIHFMNIAGNTAEQQQAFMALTLVHETAHTFNMHEAYLDDEHCADGEMCIMDYYNENDATTIYNAVLSGTQPFCDSCAYQIRNNILESITK